MSAVFSTCGRYRYHLGRTVSLLGRGSCLFVLLNPSTADTESNDPTVTRCCGFAERWGFTGLEVVNLFGLRSTDPRALRGVLDPVGPENDSWIVRSAQQADLVVCGWGTHGSLRGRGVQVLELLLTHGVVPHALRMTRGGQPQHPLYLPRGLRPFPIGEAES